MVAMGNCRIILIIHCFLTMILPGVLPAQDTRITGMVKDSGSGDPLPGVNIYIKEKLIGTITGTDGTFQLSTSTRPPFVVIASLLGYAKQEIQITEKHTVLDIRLDVQPILGREIVISASRVEENIMESPVTIEKLNIREIQRTEAANYFDGLYKLKGVDMNVHSLTFRFPNTRGFTGENNYRLNQLIDGVDNTAPGLSFPAGNIFGLSPVEVESVELLVGASSALYGPGGMNGILLMKSKSPFDYPGLTLSLQTGIMHVGAGYRDDPTPMTDFNFRYAKVFRNRLAFRIGGTYLSATDWYAADYRDKNHLDEPWINRNTNEGYDGVNVYGDDIIAPVNLKNVAPQVAEGIAQARGLEPGTQEYNEFVNHVISLFPDQVITRSGWKELNIVDYNTRVLRFNASAHYRFTEKLEASIKGTYGQGNSVYTAQNRFSFRNFHMLTLTGELKSPDYTIRAYRVSENSGDTYNAGGAALQINEAWKPSKTWYSDYISAFAQQILTDPDNLNGAYDFARQVAENRDPHGNKLNNSQPAFPYANTPRFNALLDSIIRIPVSEGGARVLDKSQLYHLEGMYNFSHMTDWAEVIAGGNYRIYRINSEGTVFIDPPGDPLLIHQYGAYLQASKAFFNKNLKITASARYDKNDNFKGRLTPRISLVYSLDDEKDHNIRTSVQTAYRFPSIADQYVNLNVGPFTVIGGLPEVRALHNLDQNPAYPLTGPNPINDAADTSYGYYQFPEFRPERVTAFEIGYKGLFMNRMLYIDAYTYLNRYNGFLATQVLAQDPFTENEKRYQTTVSTDEPITTFGWALGADLLLPGRFYFKGNIAYDALQSLGDRPPGFQSRYNTPRYRANLSIGNRTVIKNLGFGISWRWQDKFLWQSAFGTAEIPPFQIMDAQVSLHITSLRSVIKAGASNVLNTPYNTSFGSAQIGGLYYITIMFDELMN